MAKDNITSKDVIFDLLTIAWREKNRILLVIIVSIMSYYFIVYPTDRLNYIVDSVNKGVFTFDDVKHEALKLVLVGIAFYVVYYLKDYYTFVGYDKIILDETYILQKKMYSHTPVVFKKLSIGEILSRTTNDVTNSVSPLFAYGLLCICDGFLYGGYLNYTIVKKSSILFMILVSIPFVLQVLYISSKREVQEEAYKTMATTMDNITEETLENVKGIRVIKTYNLLNKVRTSFVEKLDTYANNNVEYMKRRLLYQPTSILASACSYVISVVYGFYLIGQGSMTIGELVAICILISFLMWPYTAISEFVVLFIEAKEAARRVVEIKKMYPEVNDDKAEKEFLFNNDIKFDNFSFSYENEEDVLKNINLTISKGETIGVVGATGSGKTTLVKQILRLYPVKENSLLFDNVSVEKYFLKSIISKIGYASQEYQLFSKTIKENVLFYRTEYADNLEKVLELADLKKDIVNFKDGVDTIIGENGVSLSGGQKQRIGIARALLSNPDILILDDSLSAVDANTEKNIINNIKKYRQGKTNIIVAHRISAVRHADKIIVLNNGTIEDFGTHDELKEKNSWYEKLDEYQNKNVGEDSDYEK